jgi:hypothetical protein
MPFRLRRFAVALLGLLLVQLSLLGAGVACTVPAVGGPAASAAHGSAAGVAHHAGGHAHDGGDVAGADALPSDDAPPSGHHDGRMHCPTTMACATAAIAVAASALPDGGILARAEIVAPDATAPASVVGAPEPPPPRA